MTLKQLLTYFEGYYAVKYNPHILTAVTAYLDGCSERFLTAAAEVIPRRLSHAYKMVPGVAEFEKHMGEILDAVPEPLPEPAHRLSEGERAEVSRLIAECIRVCRNAKGPMAKTLSKAAGEIP